MYVRRCNICAACAKRRQRSEEGGRPRRVSPSCLLPRLRRSEASPPTLDHPAFPVSSLPLLKLPLTPRPAAGRASEETSGRKRDGEKERERREREREPPPLYGSAGGGGGVVSWPPWRAALSTYSHPRLTSSPSLLRFLSSLSDLASPLSLAVFFSPVALSRAPSSSLLDALAASVYPAFSPAHSPHRPP